jgi:uncharacterized protein (DUF983 family)
MARFKKTKFYSIVRLKCPRCHQGDLFLTRNPYNLKMIDKMPKRCPVCGENFERETGFYWGATMVSHATTTIMVVLIHMVTYYFYGWETIPFVVAVTTVLLLLVPITFRSSRAIWINIFVKYDPEWRSRQARR